jgi:hypothetical protein
MANYMFEKATAKHGAWNISYRFYPHFHPYIAKLIRQLIEGSVSGLQAIDTEYQKESDGTLKAFLDSTRVELSDGTQVTLLNGAKAKLDGTQVTITDRIPLTGSAQAKLPDGTLATLAKGISLKLPAGTLVKHSDGTEKTLSVETQVILLGGKPIPDLFEEFFYNLYGPSDLVEKPYPVKELDFSSSGAYAVYNWELFYHVPLTIAINLSKNQRFEEAQRWFHYVFDPTDNSEGPTPERFWKVKPFQYTDVKLIEEVLVNLFSGADKKLKDETVDCIGDWKDAPFRPHVIARYRQTSYMFKAVMAYLDNLIAWGDVLFRQDTGESINEATQIYVLAANLLGPRPQAVPKKGSVLPQTYFDVREDLDEFDNVLRDMETCIPFVVAPFPMEAADIDKFSTLQNLGKTLYFCVPRNDKLISYWDTVADRLFKIHNSLNIQGIFRQLPLFEPPIDPALLARAAAAGLDVGAIISGLNQPLPLVRFQFLVQKAAEICQEVKSLGNSLLSAMEKEDNEALAILRAKHERIVMEMMEHVKYDQLQEAIKSREGLLKSMILAIQRYTYYERQLGKKADEIEKAMPDLDDLDKESLENMKFSAQEPEVAPRNIDVDIATDIFAQAAQFLSGGKILSSHEVQESLFLEGAQLSSDIANVLNTISSAIHVIPEVKIHVQPMGVGGTGETGGSHFGWGLAATANAAKAVSERLNFEARRAARIDGFARREREWAFQSNLAAGEITQIFKQLRAAQIREAIAELELKNHRQQIKHSEEIEFFLTGEKNPDWTQKIDPKEKKTTNKAIYTWMKREVKGLYGQCFQFAFDIAKKAERALQHELGNPELSYLQFGYLAGKEGLLAGEKLYLDIKRMEMAYHDLNTREYELTKHVSLLQVDPMKLLDLRTKGKCIVRLPEEIFDMDCPGHYFRRIKSMAASIPCVVGPYTSINCTLTLLNSSIRKSPLLLNNEYASEGAEDPRFSTYFGSMQSIVTSSGQNDSGLFEANLRDERYLPFEGSGVISEWQLELRPGVHQFDYDTISDVILHIRYTAREGGELLRMKAAENLDTCINEAKAAGSMRLFSIRHEFPTEWAKFKSAKSGNVKLALELREEHFPYWSKGRLDIIEQVKLFAKMAKDASEITELTNPPTVEITYKDDKGKKATSNDLSALPKHFDSLKLIFDIVGNSMEDLWLSLIWKGK